MEQLDYKNEGFEVRLRQLSSVCFLSSVRFVEQECRRAIRSSDHIGGNCGEPTSRKGARRKAWTSSRVLTVDRRSQGSKSSADFSVARPKFPVRVTGRTAYPAQIQVANQMAGIVLFICNGGTAHARTDNFSPVLYLPQPCGA